jgi:hypothetical protein
MNNIVLPFHDRQLGEPSRDVRAWHVRWFRVLSFLNFPTAMIRHFQAAQKK